MNTETDLKLSTIVAPQLSDVEFGANVRKLFENINRNFEILANRDFVKGDKGKDVRIEPIVLGKIYEDPNIENLKSLLINRIKIAIKQSYNELELAPIYYIDSLEDLKAKVLNWDDNIVTQNSIIYLIYSDDKIISSLAYVVLDKRFNDGFGKIYVKKQFDTTHNINYTLIDEADAYENKVDTSSVVYIELNEDESDWKVSLANNWPSLYYDTDISDFCWKYQGVYTKMPARGPKGLDAVNIQNMFLVLVDNISDINRTIKNIMTPKGEWYSIEKYIDTYKTNGWPEISKGSTAVVFETNSVAGNTKYWISIISIIESPSDDPNAPDTYNVICAQSTSINNLFNENSFIDIMKRISPLSSSTLKGFFIPFRPTGQSLAETSTQMAGHCIFSSKKDGIDFKDLNIAALSDYNSIGKIPINNLLQTDSSIYVWNDINFERPASFINIKSDNIDSNNIVSRDIDSNNIVSRDIKSDNMKSSSLQCNIGEIKTLNASYIDFSKNISYKDPALDVFGSNNFYLGTSIFNLDTELQINGKLIFGSLESSYLEKSNKTLKDICELVIGTVTPPLKLTKSDNILDLNNELSLDISQLNFAGQKVESGEIFNNYDSNTAIGNYSHAEGDSTHAYGYASHAEGLGITETYLNCKVIYYDPTQSKNSFALDNTNKYINLSTGDIIKFDKYNEFYQVSIMSSLDENILNIRVDKDIADDVISVDKNINIIKMYTAYGYASHIEGQNTVSAGNYSHAEGKGSKSIGHYSHAEGNNTKAIKDYSHAEGAATLALGQWSHAEGNKTKAIGNVSHAEGLETEAKHPMSHAEGLGTQTGAAYAHAEGIYNYPGTFQSTIGIGENNENRLNAFAVTSEGKIYIKDLGDYNGTAITEGKNISKDLASVITKIEHIIKSLISKENIIDIVNNVTVEQTSSAILGSKVFDMGRGVFLNRTGLIIGEKPNYKYYLAHPNMILGAPISGQIYICNDKIYIGYTQTDKNNGILIEIGNFIENATKDLTIATSETLGGIKIGFAPIENKVPVQLSDEQAYVEIPKLTAASPGTLGGIKLGFIQNGNNYPVMTNSAGEAYVNILGQVATETQLGGVKPVTKTTKMTLDVGVDKTGRLYASSKINPLPKRDDMTLDVGVDDNGKLYTKASEKVIVEDSLTSFSSINALAASRGQELNNRINDITQGRLNSLTVNQLTASQSITTTDITYSGKLTGPSADYAEMFEWFDNNLSNEDRIGYLVTLNGDKIIKANGNDILGIISSNPNIIGNNPEEWPNKYLIDDWGRKTEVLNPDYDETKTYIKRSDRSEWSPVGLLGLLRVRLDGTLKVNDYCSAKNGIATYDKNGNIRVLKIINDNIALVLLK